MINKKLLICAATLIFLLGTASGVLANSKFKEIKASLNPDLKIELNGQLLSPMKALIYEGTTYLPVREFAAMTALDERFEYDANNNKLILGGPMYLNLFSKESSGFYQLIVNGNWRPSILTDQHMLYSNSYMGIDFYMDKAENGNLKLYANSVMEQSPGLKFSNKADIKLANKDAIELSYETSDTVGKLAIVKNGTDFITLDFYVSKTQFKAADFKEFEKIKASFNIQ